MDLESGDGLRGGPGDLRDQVVVVVDPPGAVAGFDGQRLSGVDHPDVDPLLATTSAPRQSTRRCMHLGGTRGVDPETAAPETPQTNEDQRLDQHIFADQQVAADALPSSGGRDRRFASGRQLADLPGPFDTGAMIVPRRPGRPDVTSAISAGAAPC